MTHIAQVTRKIPRAIHEAQRGRRSAYIDSGSDTGVGPHRSAPDRSHADRTDG